ncbi:hypothetical protein LCGC14_0498630 [marine sediment metagenome]|uniref:Uncharacterized protein n=1 Tax=marine sediment metagenome TaxID=412755 RepID=A0A0F9S9T7_9ZZZZ
MGRPWGKGKIALKGAAGVIRCTWCGREEEREADVWPYGWYPLTLIPGHEEMLCGDCFMEHREGDKDGRET